MTREEQIIETAKEYYNPKNGSPYSLQMRTGFITGAKWADEHPNLYNDEKYHTVKVSCLDELNRKAALYDTFLDKACKWLYHNTNKHIDDKYLTMYFNLTSEMIEDFRKAMEE